jgi:hypothetical protein
MNDGCAGCIAAALIILLQVLVWCVVAVFAIGVMVFALRLFGVLPW